MGIILGSSYIPIMPLLQGGGGGGPPNIDIATRISGHIRLYRPIRRDRII